MKNKLVACWHILLGRSVIYNVALGKGIELKFNPNRKSFTSKLFPIEEPIDNSVPEEYDKWS